MRLDLINVNTLIALLAISAPLLFIAYLALGAVKLDVDSVVNTLAILLAEGPARASERYPETTSILLHIRLPRALAALIAGAAFAIAGAAMQGLFRNPLASPDILGISAGSSFGAVIAITSGVALLHPLVVPMFAITGALITGSLVFFLAFRAGLGQQLLMVLLAGLAIASLLTGATSAVLLFAQQYEVSQFIFWTMGGLEGRLWQHILWPGPLMVVIALLLLRQTKALNLLAMGEENAHGMGINVAQLRRRVLVLASTLTALAIAMCGPIGFVGLMIPHLVRLWIGPDHRWLMPFSAAMGALFVLTADLAGRTLIAPYEIKVGILTAVVGGSYFVYLLYRLQKKAML